MSKDSHRKKKSSFKIISKVFKERVQEYKKNKPLKDGKYHSVGRLDPIEFFTNLKIKKTAVCGSFCFVWFCSSPVPTRQYRVTLIIKCYKLTGSYGVGGSHVGALWGGSKDRHSRRGS